jgi:putative modified peptide
MTFDHSEQVIEKSFQLLDEPVNLAFHLSESLIHTLLDKLSSDDDFRVVFQSSPRQALASIGHEAAAKATDSENGIWMCMKCKTLASKEIIRNSRDVFLKQLLSERARFNPIHLEISKLT